MPYKRPMTGKGLFKKYEYVYDELYDCYICPNNEILNYSTTDRNGYKQYRNIDKKKIIRRHIKQEWNEQLNQNRLSPEGKELYKLRKEKIERSFADSKQNHGYRYAMYKGVEKNQNYTWLICAAQNMKNMSLKLENRKYETNRNKKKQLNLAKILNLIKIFQKIFKKVTNENLDLKINRGLSTI